MKHIDIFTGSGMFVYAASQVWGTEHEPILFCEKNAICRRVLKFYWPHVPCISDIRDVKGGEYESIDVISGGDPCPIRSRARSNGKSKTPDLSGYFLRLVGECRPRWVLRENVPARDDVDFATALELLGYRTVIVRTDASAFTAQRRIRDFIIASTQDAWQGQIRQLCELQSNPRYSTPSLATRPVIPCLTTNRQRYDSRDCYVFDGRLRILDGDERQRFAGMPEGWLDGYTQGIIAKMTGNTVVPQVVIEIMKIIRNIDNASE